MTYCCRTLASLVGLLAWGKMMEISHRVQRRQTEKFWLMQLTNRSDIVHANNFLFVLYCTALEILFFYCGHMCMIVH